MIRATLKFQKLDCQILLVRRIFWKILLFFTGEYLLQQPAAVPVDAIQCDQSADWFRPYFVVVV